MISFRYSAIGGDGSSVDGVIEAEDRKSALLQLGERGLFPSTLELDGSSAKTNSEVPQAAPAPGFRFSKGIKRKEITSFTREMGALLSSGIPIPQALDGLGDEEENPALKEVVLQIGESVRKGLAFSTALEEHPRLFSKLYVSMVKVGEEAGALPKVMTDLADLLEHEDEVRGEVMAAISYPVFVLAFGIFTVTILLTVVLPRLFTMLEEMLPVLPLPTLILLRVSGFLNHQWLWVLMGIAGVVAGLRWFLRSPQGALAWDRAKLQLPVMGGVLRSAALGRFSRTLGTLVHSGVSLLPALKIVENTISNRMLASLIAQVSE